MKRILLPLMAMTIALTSCSRDNDDVTNPTNPPTTNPATLPTNPVEQRKKIKHIGLSDYWSTQGPHIPGIHEFDEGLAPFYHESFHYNGDFLSYTSHQHHTTYEGDKIISMKYGRYIIDFTYNSNGTLKSSVAKNETHGTLEESREYSYINNETIKVKEIKRSLQGEYITKEYTLTMEGDKLIKKVSSNNNTIEAYHYHYDEYENPISHIKGFAALAIERDFLDNDCNNPMTSSFRNNLVYKIYDYYDLRHSDNSYRIDATFQYSRDDKGYINSVFVGIGKAKINTMYDPNREPDTREGGLWGHEYHYTYQYE